MDFTRLMTTQDQVITKHMVGQANQEGGPQPSESTFASIVQDFVRMNALPFAGVRTTMLLNDMDISRFMVYAQQIEESKICEIGKEGKRPRSSSCATYGNQYLGKCLVRRNDVFGFGNKSQKMRYYPKIKSKGKEFCQTPSGGPDPNAPVKNHFYVLGTKKGTNLE
ncbi:hypothetical protein EJD97_006469 [Solanum chilense]|uniref:Uncharacterized protein n=1 Tax=Solanum chilense TaxID=4083 RepID=A0A6N2CHE0_SOLCI|nr:hypothetical protein EJD97_006469 [Solanum chilense]